MCLLFGLTLLLYLLGCWDWHVLAICPVTVFLVVRQATGLLEGGLAPNHFAHIGVLSRVQVEMILQILGEGKLTETVLAGVVFRLFMGSLMSLHAKLGRERHCTLWVYTVDSLLSAW